MLSEFFYLFSEYILLSESDVSDCINRLMSHGEFSFLQFPVLFGENFSFGCDVRKLWEDSVNSDKELSSLGQSSKELLLSFQECFGKIPLGVFSAKCKGYGRKFFSLYEKEEALHEKNSTLFLSSGVFAAAAVFLIFV